MKILSMCTSSICCLFLWLYADYHFVKKEDMQEAINDGKFLENAEFSGNMYGTRYVITGTHY